MVSQTLANLEGQLGVHLFDRHGRYPRLTEEGRNFGVLSPLTWRLADLGAKHAFLQAGFGWGHMPSHIVEEDVKRKRLVAITVEGFNPKAAFLPMHVIYRKDAPPGPAGQAFISQLRISQLRGKSR